MNYTRVLTAFIILYTDCLSLVIGTCSLSFYLVFFFLYISSLVPGYWVYVYINFLVQGYQLSLCIHELSCTHPMQRYLYGLSGCMYMCTWLVFRTWCVYRGTLIVCRQGILYTFISPQVLVYIKCVLHRYISRGVWTGVRR